MRAAKAGLGVALIYAGAVATWWAAAALNATLWPTRPMVPAWDRRYVTWPLWGLVAVAVLTILVRMGLAAHEERKPPPPAEPEPLGMFGGSVSKSLPFQPSSPLMLSERGSGWPAQITRALVTAGLTDPGRPVLRVAETVGTDDVTLAVHLPPGLVVGRVMSKREELAAALDVPVSRLHIGRHEGLANVADLRLDNESLPLEPRIPALPKRTCWRDKIPLGRDMRGRDVLVDVWDVPQWLIAGKSGFGKTVAMRMIFAHYALDPTAVIWGVDGKGNRDDWAGVRPRFDKWVTLSDRKAGGAQYLQLLEDLGAEIDRRQNIAGRDYPGMLVLMDDASSLRLRLSREEQAIADRLLVGIVQTCRAVNILLMPVIQRPSATAVSTDQRAQSGIALCFQMDSMDDARMALGSRPKDDVVLRLPKGEALLKTETGDPRHVLVDWLTDGKDGTPDLWGELGARFTAECSRPAIAAPHDRLLDPLQAAYDVTVASEAGRMTTEEIWAALGGAYAGTVAKLGKELTDLGWPAREPERVGAKTARFRYAADCPLHPVTAPVTPPVTTPQDAVTAPVAVVDRNGT